MIARFMKMGAFALAAMLVAGCNPADDSWGHAPDPGSGSENQTPDTPATDNSGVVLWKSGDQADGKVYPNFRIPTLIKTPTKILAFCEARESNSSDRGDIDIVMRESTDGGKTWSESKRIFDDGIHTVGNLSGVYTESGRIVALFNWQITNQSQTATTFESSLGVTWAQKGKHSRRVFSTWSDDEGKTWAKPVDITEDVMESAWTWNACGPVHAIQLQNGDHKGRIIVPCDLKTPISGTSTMFSYLVYSDDNGQTWQKSHNTVLNGNECVAVELSDGRIFVDMRNWDIASGMCRGYTFSSDAGETLGAIMYDPLRPEPSNTTDGGTHGCQGSAINYSLDGKPTSKIITCNPAGENPITSKRKNLTLYFSNNNVKTWNGKYQVTDKFSGYSDITVLPNGDLGILYENGNAAYKEQISFKIISKNSFENYLL